MIIKLYLITSKTNRNFRKNLKRTEKSLLNLLPVRESPPLIYQGIWVQFRLYWGRVGGKGEILPSTEYPRFLYTNDVRSMCKPLSRDISGE